MPNKVQSIATSKNEVEGTSKWKKTCIRLCKSIFSYVTSVTFIKLLTVRSLLIKTMKEKYLLGSTLTIIIQDPYF